MTVTASQAVPRTEVVGRSILVVAALTTAVMAGIAIGQLGGATPQTIINETTSALSLAVFAGLFALLAWRPVSYPGVMELCFGLKLGITLIALGQREADGAWLAIIVNGLIALGLLVAYVLLRCYRAWHRQAFVRDSVRKSPAEKRSARKGGGTKAPGGTKAAVGGKSSAQPEADAKKRVTPPPPEQPGGTPGQGSSGRGTTGQGSTGEGTPGKGTAGGPAA